MVHYVESDPTHDSRVGSGAASANHYAAPAMGAARIIRVNQGEPSPRGLSTHEVGDSQEYTLSKTPAPVQRGLAPSSMAEPRRSRSGLQGAGKPVPSIKVVTKIISSSASKGPGDPGSRDEAGTQITMDYNGQVEIGQLSSDEFDLPASLACRPDGERDPSQE